MGVKIGLEQFPTPPKRWGPNDQAVLDSALRTGRLPDPDNRVATQERLALYLGFSRQTIAKRIGGQLPLHIELKREGGSRGGMTTAYRRRVARVRAMEMGKEAQR